MAKAKEHLNLAFIGHVDHGKSTLVGHLLLKAGAIAEQLSSPKILHQQIRLHCSRLSWTQRLR